MRRESLVMLDDYLRDWAWCDASDRELARRCRCSEDDVRSARNSLDRVVLCADVLAYAREIARLTESPLPLSTIIVDAMRLECVRLQAAAAEWDEDAE